jgi:hypothetical protein
LGLKVFSRVLGMLSAMMNIALAVGAALLGPTLELPGGSRCACGFPPARR